MSSIIARDVVVDFPIYGASSRSLKKNMMFAATGGLLSKDTADRVTVRALDNISFEFKEGDRVGLVGHNGSGKSTLLRLIAGVYEPVNGNIVVNGRVTSMLSITMGMDYEATGIENINIRGYLMGMNKKQITELIDDVISFAGLGDYLLLPVRTYSSGMAMRLAFAISTGFDAEIILMDEWLSAGDADFAEKSEVRINEMVNKASIVVIASHNQNLVEEKCNKIIELKQGKIAEFHGQ